MEALGSPKVRGRMSLSYDLLAQASHPSFHLMQSRRKINNTVFEGGVLAESVA